MPSRYSKAIGGFIGTLVALGGALLSLGVLSGSASHDVAVILAALTPLAGALGAAVAPPNSLTNQPVQQSTADLVKALADEYHSVEAAFGVTRQGGSVTPIVTYTVGERGPEVIKAPPKDEPPAAPVPA